MNSKLLKNILYNSGNAFLPDNINQMLAYDIIGSHKKTFYISGWSILHFINGLIFGYLYLYLHFDKKYYIINLFVLHSIWELWQITIGMSRPYSLSGRSNLIDTIVDTILFMTGALIIRNLIIRNLI
jgi:VanZ family protein